MDERDAQHDLRRFLRQHVNEIVGVWTTDGSVSEGTLTAVHHDYIVLVGTPLAERAALAETSTVIWILIGMIAKVSVPRTAMMASSVPPKA